MSDRGHAAGRRSGVSQPLPPASPPLAVLAPAPMLTVTVEASTDGGDEVHLHPGGQGYWIARLAAELGAAVTLCGTFGGEAGAVVRRLLDGEPLETRGPRWPGANGVYVHDRRSGERRVVAHMPPEPLDRHTADDLYGTTLVAAIEAGTLAVAGPTHPRLLPRGFVARLAGDARRSGVRLVADLSGDTLAEVLRVGVDVVKISLDELRRDGFTNGDGTAPVLAAMRRFAADGVGAVVVTRAEESTLVLDGEGGEVVEVSGPPVKALDPRGGGDSLTASVAVAVARGDGVLDGVRLGAAAATLNVTRRGLGSGRREDIERLAGWVTSRAFGSGQAG